MRSPKTKEAADRVAAIALRSRLAIEQGAPRYHLIDSDRLPYLVFSATFGRDGFDKPNALTGLLMLNVPCPQGAGRSANCADASVRFPTRCWRFAGVSGVTLKVVVRCDLKDTKNIDKDSCLGFMREAHENAARLYTSLAMCDLLVGEQSLTRGCRMSYDPQLYYNPEALPMPVVREARDPLGVYAGTKADDDGTVVWYPDSDERNRIDLEFQTCLSEALDDQPENMKACLQALADYCAEGLPRGGGLRGACRLERPLQAARHGPDPEDVPQCL